MNKKGLILVHLGCERVDFGPERGDFRSERVNLGHLGLISSLNEPDFGLRGRGGDGRRDG